LTIRRLILQEFLEGKGDAELLIATSLAEVGLDFKGLHTVVIVGPANTIEQVLQACGRCARDLEIGTVLIYYNNTDTKAATASTKALLETDECRQKMMYSCFGEDMKNNCGHMCDNCRARCATYNCIACKSRPGGYFPQEEKPLKPCGHPRSYHQVQEARKRLVEYIDEQSEAMKRGGMYRQGRPKYQVQAGWLTGYVEAYLDAYANGNDMNDYLYVNAIHKEVILRLFPSE
jgi:superfamily II DNA or RNA helicase